MSELRQPYNLIQFNIKHFKMLATVKEVAQGAILLFTIVNISICCGHCQHSKRQKRFVDKLEGDSPCYPRVQSMMGPKGNKGEPGMFGLKGDKGERGKSGIFRYRRRPGLPGMMGPPGHPGIPGVDGCNGTDGYPGIKGNVGNPGPSGIPGYPGAKGEKGQSGIPGTPGVPGLPGMTGLVELTGIPGLDGRNGTDGYPGIKGNSGDPGPRGLPGYPGAKGEKGEATLCEISLKRQKSESGRDRLCGLAEFQGPIGPDGRQGPMGDKGERGYPGYPGLIGDKGEPGLAGTTYVQKSHNTPIPGSPGKPGFSGTLIVKHSQTDEIPQCGDGFTKLWEGYSFLFIEGKEKAHSQDLGQAGSCLIKFGFTPFLFCNLNDGCVHASQNDKAYWLSTNPSTSNTPQDEQQIESYSISRCVVCEAPGNVITVHSQSTIPPDCPSGWSGLWLGYSFIMHIGTEGSGQSLSSPGSCLKDFRASPFIECKAATGTCSYHGDKLSFWLAAIEHDQQFQTSQTQTLKDNARDKVGRCQVCMRNLDA